MSEKSITGEKIFGRERLYGPKENRGRELKEREKEEERKEGKANRSCVTLL
jgi:hypothetical protein